MICSLSLVPNMLLRSMKLLPIFRARDAKASIARSGNSNTLDECYQLFTKNKIILIFSEGDSWPEKNVRKFKNGTANMALDLYKKGNKDLCIVPCGINYSHFGKGRRNIHVAFGNAVEVEKVIQDAGGDERKLAVDLSQNLQSEVEKLVVTSEPENESMVDLTQLYALNTITEPSLFLHVGSSAQNVVRKCANPSGAILDYHEKLKELKINDRNVVGKGFNYPAIFLSLITSMVSIPAFLLYLLCWIGGGKLTDKMVKSKIFKDSIYFGFGLLSTLILLIVIFVLSFSLYNTIWAWVVIAAAIAGMISWFNAVEEFPLMLSEIRYLSLSEADRNEIQELREKSLD